LLIIIKFTDTANKLECLSWKAFPA